LQMISFTRLSLSLAKLSSLFNYHYILFSQHQSYNPKEQAL
jgi:hypothetical protein